MPPDKTFCRFCGPIKSFLTSMIQNTQSLVVTPCDGEQAAEKETLYGGVYCTPSLTTPNQQNDRSTKMSTGGHQGDLVLSQQLNQAKEMGYSDAEILAALEMSNNETKNKPFEPFHSTSEMIDALSLVQKLGHRLGSGNRLPVVSGRQYLRASSSSLPSLNETYSLDGVEDKTPDKLFPSRWTSSAVSSYTPHRNGLSGSTSNLLASKSINRSVSFNEPARKETAAIKRSPSFFSRIQLTPSSSSAALRRYLAEGQPKSSVQRLIDTFENENRRHFEEFQRINNELRSKLEISLREESHLKELLRTREDRLEQQEVILKNQTDLENRFENTNKRVEDLTKELELRKIELRKQMCDLHVLRRHQDTERRKAEEIKNSLNAEIGRLIRENANIEELHRENTALKSDLIIKEELLQKQRHQLHNQDQLGGSSSPEVNVLRAQIQMLEQENHELSQRQTQGSTCGVCMDNRREVIFMPCLHFTCCKSCSDSMHNCSICRLRIMGKIEFFQ